MHASPYGTSVKGFQEGDGPRFVRVDVLLLLAVLGLVACSLYAIGTATQDDIAGSPYHFVVRQAAYCTVGFAVMLLISRFDYSRLREWRAGLYGVMIAALLVVYALGSVSRGSRRSIELPFFQLQTSELAKV
ncbi:MAG: FtsW/RodA/SpoVE family cell cycle protein, partial [Actinomycetota bacterium]|nr:FtsW/RodA/SpoVE family cell cycle protein [Actinomycetota bacterium]